MIVVFALVAFGAGLSVAAAVWLFMGPGAGARVRRIFGVGGAASGALSGAGRGAGTLSRGRGESGGRGRFGDRVRAFVMRVRGRGDGAGAVDGSEDSPMIAVIDRAVQLLKVGIEPARAMTLVADLPDNEVAERVLRKVARAMELGEKPDQALRMYAGELGDEDARILTGMASVWFVSEQAGAPAAEMLASYASTCRVRESGRGGVDADLLAKAVGVELAGTFRDDAALGEKLDRGEGLPRGRTHLARFASYLFDDVYAEER